MECTNIMNVWPLKNQCFGLGDCTNGTTTNSTSSSNNYICTCHSHWTGHGIYLHYHNILCISELYSLMILNIPFFISSFVVTVFALYKFIHEIRHNSHNYSMFSKVSPSTLNSGGGNNEIYYYPVGEIIYALFSLNVSTRRLISFQSIFWIFWRGMTSLILSTYIFIIRLVVPSPITIIIPNILTGIYL